MADAIVKAALDPSSPLRTIVGPDAQGIAAARGVGDFEAFEAGMRAVLDWWE
ncbi:MAG: hypothetical protein ACKO2K_08060 [Alphaproteobacteria bacterium]